jgi:pilus assembly protein Flp/PilA
MYREDGMSLLIAHLHSLLRREEGQDLLEYALLIALIAIVCIGAITAAGLSVQTTFQSIADNI